jgi:Fe-S cluster assembly ATP-binding protein
MSILKPSLSILDETDSGLDVDALKTVMEGVNKIKNNNSSFLIITHYKKLLDYITPDFVHVIKDGTIVKTGDKSIAQQIETEGYKNL